MKRKRSLYKLLSIMMVVTMMISCLSVTAFAEDSISFPENSVLEMEELNAGDEEIIPENSISETMSDEELGADEGEEIIPDDAVSDYAGDEENLDAEEDFPEDSESEVVSEEEELGDAEYDEEDLEMGDATDQIGEEPEEGEEELGANPSVSLSSSRVDVKKGEKKTVTVSYSGVSGLIYLQYGISTSGVCSARWGSWSGSKIPLTIEGTGRGSTYIYIYLKNYNTGQTLAYNRIAVYTTENNPQLQSSSNNVNVNQGSSTKVTMTASGYSGAYYLQFSQTSDAFSCSWGGWSGSSIPLTITGKNSGGSGYVYVYMKDYYSGSTLASLKIYVAVNPNAKLTLSSSSVTLKVGEKVAIKATYSNYYGYVYMNYGTTNSSAYSASWGNWSGSSIPLNVTGKSAGSGTITVYLRNAYTDAVLASASCRINVVNNAKVTPSTGSVSIKAGASTQVSFTVTGASGEYYLQFGQTNSNAFSCSWGSWSGSTIPLTITGKNAGSGTINVYMKSYPSGNLLASTSVSVTVTSGESAKVTVSPTSLKLTKGNSENVRVGWSGLSVVAYLQFGISNTSVVSCAWGSYLGNAYALSVKGLSKGTATVYVYLKNSATNAVLSYATLSVTVEDSGNDSNVIDNLSYSFKNFGKAADLSLCQYMFGDNSYAKAVYNERVGSGGNCFGMASTSGMMYTTGNGVNVSSFNSSASKIKELQKSNYSSNYRLNVEQFIMGMQMSQCSPYCRWTYSSLNSIVSAVRSGASAKKPVLIGIDGVYNGNYCGHAILGYGVESVDSTTDRILIYDNNYPLEQRYMTMKKNSSGTYTSWSYPLTSDTEWGTGKSGNDISILVEDDYLSLWNKRGSLAGPGYNLLLTNSDDLSIYDVNDKLVATVEDGKITTEQEDIIQVRYREVNLSGSNVDRSFMLLVPVKVYTVINDDEEIETFKAEIVNVDLDAKVHTSGNKVVMCADDDVNLSSILLEDAKGESYEITLSSSRPGELDKITYNGVGEEETVSVMMLDGELETENTDGAEITSGSINGADDKIFSDVPSTYAFAKEIAWASKNKIVSGYADGTFKPQGQCKRKQIVAFLWRLSGTPAPKSLEARFKDVSTKTDFYKAIYWASENKIVLGYGNGKFGPDDTCTRGQVVAFLWRLAGRPAPKTQTSKFTDVKQDNSFYKAILWASENGIVKGYDDKTFKPDNTCTRGQIVAFIYRYSSMK